MRTIRTLILRLVVNQEEPYTLRGAVRSVPDDEMRPFVDEEGLLAVLRQLLRPSAERPAPVEKGDEEE